MAKNHADLRAALFDAFGYLADPLARCAFNEEQFYREIEPAITNFEKENLIVWVYVVILQYSAQVRRIQWLGKGKRHRGEHNNCNEPVTCIAQGLDPGRGIAPASLAPHGPIPAPKG
jgi:hypothetical protein